MQKNLNIEKIIFKDVQMKFLAMHITVVILTIIQDLNIKINIALIIRHLIK